MTKITFTTAAGSINRYNDLDNYSLSAVNYQTETSGWIDLVYDEGQFGPIDADDYSYRIRINFSDATFYETENPESEGVNFNGGAIDRVSYFSQEGDLQIKMTDVPFGLGVAKAFLTSDDGRAYFDLLIGQDAVWTGGDFAEDAQGSHIRTGAGDDVVNARGGRDYISDNGGADIYRGGSGEDTLDYSGLFYRYPWMVQTGVDVDLKAKTVMGPDGNLDRVYDIEQVRGTFLDDTMRGNSADNDFAGGLGDDFFDGRGGRDLVSYRNDQRFGGEEGIIVKLAQGTIRDGFGDTDTVVRIEEVEGTDYRDIFCDDTGDNAFEGRNGDDKFVVGRGEDDMEGGEGADMFVFKGTNFGSDWIGDFNYGEGDRIKIQTANNVEDITYAEDGFGTLVTLNGNSEIRLEGVTGLTDDAFVF